MGGLVNGRGWEAVAGRQAERAAVKDGSPKGRDGQHGQAWFATAGPKGTANPSFSLADLLHR